jgi:hypothetical protein
MSSGTLVLVISEFWSCLCLWCWLWHGLGAPVPAFSRLEVGSGVLVVGVVGVCCKPKGWCGTVAILWRFLCKLNTKTRTSVAGSLKKSHQLHVLNVANQFARTNSRVVLVQSSIWICSREQQPFDLKFWKKSYRKKHRVWEFQEIYCDGSWTETRKRIMNRAGPRSSYTSKSNLQTSVVRKPQMEDELHADLFFWKNLILIFIS